MANFLIAADRRQLKRFCDKMLNISATASIRYEPLFSHILLTYTELSAQATNEVGQKIGWLRHTDLVFWISAIAMARLPGGVYAPQRLVWFPAYFVVDSPYSMATGREVFGHHKIPGQFERPQSFESPAFTANVLTFDAYDPDQEGQMNWLLRIRPIEANATSHSEVAWHSGPEFFQAIIQMLIEQETPEILSTWTNDFLNLAVHHLKPAMQMVFLKQFRSAEDFSKADYQAVIEAPFKLTRFSGGGPLQDRYELKFNTLKDYNIAQELGLQLQQNTQQNIRGFWLDVAFNLEPGTVIYATTN